MAKLKLSISFRRQYQDIYQHLLLQTNRSDYVCRLIEADMNKKEQLSEIEIRRVVMEILEKQGISQFGFVSEKPNQLSNADVEIIQNLF